MPRSLAITSLLLLAVSSVASAASSCTAFDTNWNLLAFNFGGKDYNAGTQDTWAQGQSSLTSPHRPSTSLTPSRRYRNRHNSARPTVNTLFSPPSLVCCTDAFHYRPFNGPNVTCYLSEVSIYFTTSFFELKRPSVTFAVYKCGLCLGRRLWEYGCGLHLRCNCQVLVHPSSKCGQIRSHKFWGNP